MANNKTWINASQADDELVYISWEKLQGMMYKPVSVYIITVYLSIVIVVGIISNGSYIIVFCRSQRMRTLTNYYLLTMACSDLIYLIFVVTDKQLRYCIT